ncbi:MAG: hypothetical protein HZC43_03025 [Nitrosomonadales bacterium]|nr:hypothetical protein [Nitrosomonadales bacterium]
MKKLVLSALALAAVVLFARPSFAEHAHDSGSTAQAAPEDTAAPAEMMCDHENMLQQSLQKMRAQMAQINQTRDQKKRQKLLQEHNKSMRDSIGILREMMAEMAVGLAPSGPMAGRMMSGNRAGAGKMGGNMTGMKCDHMKMPLSGQHEGNADAAAVARSNPDQAAGSGDAPAGSAKKLWTCPMHPDVVQDHPGICQKCGMDLLDKEQMEAPSSSGQSSTIDPMRCDHRMGGMKGCCMGGDGAKCGHRMGSGMKCDHKMSGAGQPMKGMAGRHMNAMLALMEQMLAHNEAVMAGRR